MKWFRVVLIGVETLKFVVPGGDDSEAISLARREVDGLLDFKHVECSELSPEESEAVGALALSHTEKSDGCGCPENCTEADEAYRILCDCGVCGRDLAVALDEINAPDEPEAKTKSKGGKEAK